jgi:gliding motility-associated lipoprotein GldB
MIFIRNKTTQIYLIFFTAWLLTACSPGKKPDLSHIDVSVKIERFDHDFDSMRVKPMATQSAYLLHRYGPFYADYIQRILLGVSVQDSGYFGKLRQVFAHRDYKALKHDVDSIYPNLNKQEAELTEAFKHIKYYYASKNLPRLYAYFSGFQAQTTLGNGYMGIGLDMFLGANSRFYPALIEKLPHYITRRFTPENITPRVVEGLAREDMFPENEKDKTLLSKMIYNGKILYFMDQILPDTPDSLKIGYTPQQLKWCTDFEAQLWGYFLEQKLLYESDYPKIQEYLTEAPFTPGLGDNNESAPKLGEWTGWQIVRAYMSKNPEVTLQELMADEDAQKILNQSKYHPKLNRQE